MNVPKIFDAKVENFGKRRPCQRCGVNVAYDTVADIAEDQLCGACIKPDEIEPILGPAGSVDEMQMISETLREIAIEAEHFPAEGHPEYSLMGYLNSLSVEQLEARKEATVRSLAGEFADVVDDSIVH